jgi:CRISPR-associated endonuclease/helicase Cas3
MHYAHSTEREDRSDWQSLADHHRAVAELAGDRGSKFGARNAAHMAGCLHDLGKYSPAFQVYIAGHGYSVDHSTAGAREVMNIAKPGVDKIVAELVAYAIAGHHAGLPDRQGVSASLDARLNDKRLPELDPVWTSEIQLDAGALWPANFRLAAPPKSASPAEKIAYAKQAAFQLAFLGRMIFSCLVDADFIDTERHYAEVRQEPVDREWPTFKDNIERLISSFDSYMERKLVAIPEPERGTPLNTLRRDILSRVRNKAEMPKGVFTLEVPTGGGKTLASLAFALEHAKHWSMDRIVYSIPFTSIIDQTAAIFRTMMGKEWVLEHHSQIESETAQPEDRDERRDQHPEAKLRRAMENWDAPIVVTTNVQLFESLFAHRPSRCRKLHNLANAVIILDEAQTIPLHVLRPCVAALDELARNYGCTIVLCTATQPALLAPAFARGFEKTQELAPDPARLHDAFRRVTLRVAGELSDDALLSELGDVDQGLVIVNSRKHALALYLAAKAKGIEGLVHLTTRQTAADRRQILTEVRRRLCTKEPCRVIATSLIEAGVDISFPRVWRAEAGLDQIIQAAGRCNREWERPKEESFVILFLPTEAQPPSEIKDFAAVMRRVASKHSDLFSQAAIETYFQEVYWQKGDGLDRISVKNLNGENVHGSVRESFAVNGGATNFSYRTVGESFRLIEDGMEPVIIAIEDKPKDVLKALRRGMPAGKAARELQSYLVQIPPKYRNALIENGHAAFIDGFDTQFVVLKTESFYSREQGLVWEKADELGIEGNTI